MQLEDPRIIEFDVRTDEMLVNLKQTVSDLPGINDLTFLNDSSRYPTFILFFKRGVNTKVLVETLQRRIQSTRFAFSDTSKHEEKPVVEFTIGSVTFVNISRSDKLSSQDSLRHIALANILPAINGVEGVATTTLLSGSHVYSVFRFKLNRERLREQNLSADDILKACRSSDMIHLYPRLIPTNDPASLTIEYIAPTALYPIDSAQFANRILGSLPDGTVLRLRDVAQIEAGPLYPSFAHIGSSA